MKTFLILMLMSVSSIAQGASYKRPVDLMDPYAEVSQDLAEPLDSRELMTARRQVGEVCQDLSLYLKKHPDPNMTELMSDCNPDAMSSYTMQACRDAGAADSCPVAEALTLYVALLREYIKS